MLRRAIHDVFGAARREGQEILGASRLFKRLHGCSVANLSWR